MELYRDPSQTVENRVLDLVGRMSLAEKIGQLNQFLYGWKCYRRTAGTIELTEEFCEAVRHGGQGAIYGLFRADPWTGATFGSGLLPEIGRAHV